MPDNVTQLHQYGKGGYEGTRKRIHLAIVNGEEFKSGALRGDKEWWGVGRLPTEWVAVFHDQEPDYVVYSYQTPIAWHWTVPQDERRSGWAIPDVKYSGTTTRHQSFARVALAMAGPIETLDDERLR